MRPSSGPVFGRPLVFFSLFGLFLLVFVVTPLWTRFPGLPAQAAAWTALVSAGFAWAWWASGSIRLPQRPILPYFLIFTAAALSFNALAMGASIPWRGDEDHHVVFAWDLAKALAHRPWYLAMPLLPLLLGFSLRHDGALGWKTVLGASAMAALATAIALTAHLEMDNYDTWYHILRYPILLKYIAAVPVYLVSLLPISYLPETPYRLLPLLSAVGLATLAADMLRKSPLWFRLAAGLAILTLPLVRYYSTIFYLEMPAVLCMAWAAFRADRLLRADPARLPAMPAWYALLLVGFIKETTLPFLAAFVMARVVARFLILRRRGPLKAAPLLREAGILYAVCLPLFLYLFFRTWCGDPRPAGLWLNNLKDAHLALRLLHSLADSFALLLAAAMAGFLLAARRRRFLSRLAPTLFLFAAAAMSAGLHYLDDYSFIGYSRFNLFLLPTVLAFAWPFLRLAASRKRSLAGAGLAALIAVNIILSPIHWDGTKKPGWGVYGVDTGEHYYPYREALKVLKAGHAGEKALLTGHYYGYLARFYTGDRNFPVQRLAGLELVDEGRRMDSTLAAAADSGYQVVLYHVLGKEYRPLENLHSYGNVQVFKNRAHVLVLFSR